ncbi:MAG: phosphohistidine phosphatase SixA [Acidobacteriota bacterium]|nr:phosphohistidine phosphatase SixA [Acidobacteriota bacterium]
MDIWLLRHASAEDRARSGRDSDRVLTPEGLARAEHVAHGLALLEPGISRVVTSPYRRARQTAEAAAKALGISAVSESRALEPERDAQEILVEVAESGSDVLLVGHQPHLGALLGLLVAAGTEMPLKKAGVARVTLDGRWSGTLRAFLPPEVLERLGRSAPGR